MKTVRLLFAVIATAFTAGVTSIAAESTAAAAPWPPSEATVAAALKGYRAALVIVTLPAGKTWRYNPELCAEPLAPCSTFKIVNTLCALENGIVTGADTVLPWDGRTRAQEAWNRDLTLRQAVAVSAVPHFQQLAARIGAPSMQAFLDRIDYGNRDISGGLTEFWLGSSLKISADAQVDFLRRLLTGKIELKPQSMKVLKAVLRQIRTGNERGTLYAKTGTLSGKNNKAVLGWYIGWIEYENGSRTIFALNLRDGVNPSGATARRLAAALFAKLGML